MKNFFSILIVLVLFFVSCSSPMDQYANEIHDLHIEQDLYQLNVEQMSQSIDMFLKENKENNPSSEEKDLLFEKASEEIKMYQQSVGEIINKLNELQVSNEEVLNSHNILINVVDIYYDLGQTSEKQLLAIQEVHQLLYKVQQSNEELVNLMQSGNSTSMQYNNALSNAYQENKSELEVIDVITLQDQLSKEVIDVGYFQQGKIGVGGFIESLDQLGVEKDIDKKHKDILISMFTSLYELLEYLITNHEIIETTNQYTLFSEYSSEQINVAETLLEAWKEEMK